MTLYEIQKYCGDIGNKLHRKGRTIRNKDTLIYEINFWRDCEVNLIERNPYKVIDDLKNRCSRDEKDYVRLRGMIEELQSQESPKEKVFERSSCDCISYNDPQTYQETPSVNMYIPEDWFPGDKTKTVCIDACIAPVIKHLWENGVATGGSCCGHNDHYPNVGLYNNNPNSIYVEYVYKLIADIDNREWKVFAPANCVYNAKGEFVTTDLYEGLRHPQGTIR